MIRGEVFLMSMKNLGALGAFAVALATLVPVSAQQPAAGPTEKDPLKFTAFAVNMNNPVQATLSIEITRWTTPAERQELIALIPPKANRESDQTKLYEALKKIKPPTGYIRTSQMRTWELKYANESKLPDGTRQIVIVTDKVVTIFGASSLSDRNDYPFSMIELRLPPGGGDGTGQLLGQTAISAKDGRLQLEIYGQEPTKLTTVKQETKKK
jgi:hypothetical protein